MKANAYHIVIPFFDEAYKILLRAEGGKSPCWVLRKTIDRRGGRPLPEIESIPVPPKLSVDTRMVPICAEMTAEWTYGYSVSVAPHEKTNEWKRIGRLVYLS